MNVEPNYVVLALAFVFDRAFPGVWQCTIQQSVPLGM
jgi:hypothetical protein